MSPLCKSVLGPMPRRAATGRERVYLPATLEVLLGPARAVLADDAVVKLVKGKLRGHARLLALLRRVGGLPPGVEHRSADALALQRVIERRLVNGRSSAHVDQNCGGLHLGEVARADELLGLPRHWQRHEHVVRHLQQLDQGVLASAEPLERRRHAAPRCANQRHDPHAEGAGAQGHLLAHVSVANDTERLAVYLAVLGDQGEVLEHPLLTELGVHLVQPHLPAEDGGHHVLCYRDGHAVGVAHHALRRDALPVEPLVAAQRHLEELELGHLLQHARLDAARHKHGHALQQLLQLRALLLVLGLVRLRVPELQVPLALQEGAQQRHLLRGRGSP
mmetsp:Transcript_3966/g.14098  ORF Transcript_3966/g.14098 Transcript_3966/m.14098 type:complete len:334 (-) Transcript_3966:173-1174(-)